MATAASSEQIHAADAATTTQERPSPPWELPLIFVAAIVPYLRSLRFDFVYDDQFQLALPAIHSWSAVPGYFFKSIPGVSTRYYRPMVFLWFRLNDFLWGPHAWSWHLTSLALHAAASVLVLLTLSRYFKDRRCALAGALVFAVHPAHVETVAWISGCTDSLMCIGLFSSLLLWMKNREKPAAKWRIGSLLCCALALLSKEIAIVLPVLIAIHVLAAIPASDQQEGTIRNRLRLAFWEAAPYAAITAAYLAVRSWALTAISGTPDWISTGHSLLTLPLLLLSYGRHLIWPVGLSIFYDFPIVHRPRSYLFWLPTVALLAVAGGIYMWFRHANDARIVIAALWILLPIAPVLYIRVFQLDDFIHDRYLYLAVMGVSVLTALLGESLWKREPAKPKSFFPAAVTGLLVTCLGFATGIQAEPWRSNLSLYTHAVLVAPKNTVARHNLATEYAKEGRNEEASIMLRALLNDRPDMWQANYNYGCVNFQIGNLDVAEEYLRRAIRLDASEPNQYLYLGIIYFRKGRAGEAAAEVRQAIARRPDGNAYHFTLGMIELQLGDITSAGEEMEKELKYHPENANRVAQAQGMFQHSIKIAP